MRYVMDRKGFVPKEVLDWALTFRIYVSVEMYIEVHFSSVQFSRSVVSDSL